VNTSDSSESYHDDPITTPSKARHKFSTQLLASLLVLTGTGLFFQNTFASLINFNSNTALEFGQGIFQTVACSGSNSLKIVPTSSFVNTAGGGAHYFDRLTISNVPDSCWGNDLTIKAYGNSDSKPLALFNTTSTDAVISDNSGNFEGGVGSTGLTVTKNSSGNFTIIFTTPVAAAALVFKMTITSAVHTLPVWVQQTSAGSSGWVSVASSADGVNLVAAGDNASSYIYTSRNSGVTWKQESDGPRNMQVVASSRDGNHLVAAYWSGFIQIASYDGTQFVWGDRLATDPDNLYRSWCAVAISDDGTRVVAVEASGDIWVSTDSGATWVDRSSGTSSTEAHVAMSSDGMKIVATSINDFYFSTDGGENWSHHFVGGDSWFDLASSSDGTKLAAVGYNGRIYTSNDSGGTWAIRSSAGTRDWYGVTISDDGSRVGAVAFSINRDFNTKGDIWLSSDSGATWTKQVSAGQANWRKIASSSDGKKIIAVSAHIFGNTGAIWTVQLP
jgi:hypothetical protein